ICWGRRHRITEVRPSSLFRSARQREGIVPIGANHPSIRFRMSGIAIRRRSSYLSRQDLTMDRQHSRQASHLDFEFSGEIWYWRGPSPYHFVTVPEAQSIEFKAIVPLVTYGWGMIPVQAQVGSTIFTTSLFHKNGRYVLPIKDSVRKAEGVEEGDQVTA